MKWAGLLKEVDFPAAVHEIVTLAMFCPGIDISRVACASLSPHFRPCRAAGAGGGEAALSGFCGPSFIYPVITVPPREPGRAAGAGQFIDRHIHRTC
jgi:hypothetical protein